MTTHGGSRTRTGRRIPARAYSVPRYQPSGPRTRPMPRSRMSMSGRPPGPRSFRTRRRRRPQATRRSSEWKTSSRTIRSNRAEGVPRLSAASLLVESLGADRRAAVSCGLLVGVREFDQLRFTPCSSEQLEPDRQSVWGEAARDNDGRQPGIGAELAVAAHLRLADHVRLAADRRIGERLDAVIGHRLQDRLPKDVPLDDVGKIFLRVAGFDGLRVAQVRLDRRVKFPGGQYLFERSHRCAWVCGQISVEVELEVLPQDQKPVRSIRQQIRQPRYRDLDDVRALAFH